MAPLPIAPSPPKRPRSMWKKPPVTSGCIPAPLAKPADGGTPAAPRDPPHPNALLGCCGSGRCSPGWHPEHGWHTCPPEPPAPAPSICLCSPPGRGEGGGFLIKAFKEPSQNREVTVRKRHPRLPMLGSQSTVPLHHCHRIPPGSGNRQDPTRARLSLASSHGTAGGSTAPHQPCSRRTNRLFP